MKHDGKMGDDSDSEWTCEAMWGSCEWQKLCCGYEIN